MENEQSPRYLKIKVRPRASKNEITGQLADGTIKLSVTAPPTQGKANESVIKLLAEHLGVPKSSVYIISGHTSATKLIRIRE